MGKGNKTVSVADLLEFANNLNKLFPTDSVENIQLRLGVNAMIEHALFRSGNYQGYTMADPTVLDSKTTGYCYLPSEAIAAEYKKLADERKAGNGFRQ